MRWFRRSTRLPAEVEQSWRASLAALTTAPGRVATQVLAIARTAPAPSSPNGGWLVAAAGLLSRTTDDGWAHLRWSEIEHGGWNPETGKLQWQRVDGGRGSVVLPEPERVPMVFRERVRASFAFTQTVPVTETAGIVVSARRDLGDPNAPLSWHTTLQRGLTWQQPGIRDLADSSLARLRAEFDPGWT